MQAVWSNGTCNSLLIYVPSGALTRLRNVRDWILNRTTWNVLCHWRISTLLTFPTIFGDDLARNNCGNLNENDLLNIFTIWKWSNDWFESNAAVSTGNMMQLGGKSQLKQVCNRSLIAVSNVNQYYRWTNTANERTHDRRRSMECLSRTECLLTSAKVFGSFIFALDWIEFYIANYKFIQCV